MSRTIDVVVGQGEVGKPLRSLLLGGDTKVEQVVAVDKEPTLNDGVVEADDKVRTLHICYGFSDQKAFNDSTIDYCKKYEPEVMIIHSTVKPYTTRSIQAEVATPVIYSPIRGLHKQMETDMKGYTKFFSHYPHIYGWKATEIFTNRFTSLGVKVSKASSPHLLEFAKIIVDTTYYGWLIAFAQRTNEICNKERLDYDELWSFADEIHKKRGDRPKMFPGFIGGHCVIQNAKILDDDVFNFIIKNNDRYALFLED